MKSTKKTRPGLTPAQRAAEAVFTARPEIPSAEQQARKDFEDNRERLKALRLARDAENKGLEKN